MARVHDPRNAHVVAVVRVLGTARVRVPDTGIVAVPAPAPTRSRARTRVRTRVPADDPVPAPDADSVARAARCTTPPAHRRASAGSDPIAASVQAVAAPVEVAPERAESLRAEDARHRAGPVARVAGELRAEAAGGELRADGEVRAPARPRAGGQAPGVVAAGAVHRVARGLPGGVAGWVPPEQVEGPACAHPVRKGLLWGLDAHRPWARIVSPPAG